MRILVVDDEQLHRESLHSLLQDALPGAQLCAASNGRQGLELLKEHSVDVALVDIRMPVMSGLQMIDEYRRQLGRRDDVQFVLLSGYGEFAYAQQAIQLGVKRYLLKPVAIDELDALIQELTGGLEFGSPPPVRQNWSGQDDDAFAQTLVYIENHYMHPLSLEQLAGMAFFSVSYYCTLFKRRMGISFNKYLLNVRMKHAARMLCTTQQKVYEIAQNVGYSDVKYFSRLFKSVYFTTPDEYRRQAIAEQLQSRNNEDTAL